VPLSGSWDFVHVRWTTGRERIAAAKQLDLHASNDVV
jgi:hypothetical protein